MKTNWQTKKLNEVCETVNNINPEQEFENSFNYIDISSVHKGKGIIEHKMYHIHEAPSRARRPIKEGDTLFALTRPYLQNIAFVTNEYNNAVASTGFSVLRPKQHILDPKYLFFFITSEEFLNKVLPFQTGATYPAVAESKVMMQEIPLPPLKTQKEIVAKLDKKFAKLKEVKRLREEALADTEKILSQTLREFFEEGKKKGWEEKKIEELSMEIKSGFACGKQNEVAEGVVHLRTHNISLSGSINMDKIVRIPKSFVDSKVFNLKKDDIIFNNTNSAELVGKTILIKDDLPYAFSNHLTRIRLNKEIILPSWVLYVFQKYWSEKVFEKMCTRWIGQAGINQTALKNIKILLPTLQEQKKIVAKLDVLSEKVNKLKELQKSQLEDFKKLEKAYLREAFNGELV